MEAEAESKQEVSAAQETDMLSDTTEATNSRGYRDKYLPIDYLADKIPISKIKPCNLGSGDHRNYGFFPVHEVISGMLKSVLATSLPIGHLFSGNFMMNSTFLSTHFGANRNFIEYLLVLENGSDCLVSIVHPFELEDIFKAINGKGKIFGYRATLYDVAQRVVATSKAKFDAEKHRTFITEALIMDGNLRGLAEKVKLSYFKTWLDKDPSQRILKVAFFKEIILSDKEKARLKSWPRLIAALSVDEAAYEKFLDSDQFFYLSLLNPTKADLLLLKKKLDLFKAKIKRNPFSMRVFVKYLSLLRIAVHVNLATDKMKHLAIQNIARIIQEPSYFVSDSKHKDHILQCFSGLSGFLNQLTSANRAEVLRSGEFFIQNPSLYKDKTLVNFLIRFFRDEIEIFVRDNMQLGSIESLLLKLKSQCTSNEKLCISLLPVKYLDSSLRDNKEALQLLKPIIEGLSESGSIDYFLRLEEEYAEQYSPISSLVIKLALGNPSERVKNKTYRWLARSILGLSYSYDQGRTTDDGVWEKLGIHLLSYKDIHWFQLYGFINILIDCADSISDVHLISKCFFKISGDRADETLYRVALNREMFKKLTTSERPRLIAQIKHDLCQRLEAMNAPDQKSND